jgi:hypothetical protein
LGLSPGATEIVQSRGRGKEIERTVELANKLALEIEKILTDEVGEFIAKATVKKNCELVGATPDTITPDKLPELAEKIEKSVIFFSGEDAGKKISAKIKSLKV